MIAGQKKNILISIDHCIILGVYSVPVFGPWWDVSSPYNMLQWDNVKMIFSEVSHFFLNNHNKKMATVKN